MNEEKRFVPQAVSREVWDSWKRSRTFGIDPFTSGFSCVGKDELERRRRVKTDLRRVATAYMNNLYEIIKGSGSLIILSDEEGVIIDVATDEASRTLKNFPEAGSIQSEDIEGTNGIGTALACDKPVQIRGAEHWLMDNHSWTCNASAIHSGGSIIGCLNLSTPSKKGNPLSLGLIVSAVNAIERELELRHTLDEVRLLTKKQDTILKIMKNGIILISQDGRILQANQRAREILEDQSDWNQRHIRDVLRCRIDFLDLLKKGTILDSHEVSVKIRNKYSYMHISTAPIADQDSPGTLAILVQESTSMMNIVNKMSGSKAHFRFKDIIGSSKEIGECIKLGKQISRYDSPVLILGESGTGKELFAQSIHNNSSRREKPFVAVNCGALSRELIQSELFGYEGGAYTGAKSNGNPGKFELANGGTLFLDEIGELPLELQANLLRVLQTGEVNRIGSKHTKSIDVKVITATNKDLYAAVQEKTFRRDLFYRINLFTVELPPLRLRKGDIPLLAENFLACFAARYGKKNLKIHEDTYEQLECYPWPGNVRQLENVMERLAAVCRDGFIRPEDLPAEITGNRSSHGGGAKGEAYREAPAESLDQVESQHLELLLEETGGNLREVARRLNIARSTVYRKIRKYGLDPGRYRI